MIASIPTNASISRASANQAHHVENNQAISTQDSKIKKIATAVFRAITFVSIIALSVLGICQVIPPVIAGPVALLASGLFILSLRSKKPAPALAPAPAPAPTFTQKAQALATAVKDGAVKAATAVKDGAIAATRTAYNNPKKTVAAGLGLLAVAHTGNRFRQAFNTVSLENPEASRKERAQQALGLTKMALRQDGASVARMGANAALDVTAFTADTAIRAKDATVAGYTSVKEATINGVNAVTTTAGKGLNATRTGFNGFVAEVAARVEARQNARMAR